MAFSNPFKAKNRVDSIISVGTTLPKIYKPSRFDLWVKPSGDGQNIDLYTYDDNGTPNKKGTWLRKPKMIINATDPAASPTLIASNDIQTNDVWVNTTGATSVFKVWTGTAWK